MIQSFLKSLRKIFLRLKAMFGFHTTPKNSVTLDGDSILFGMGLGSSPAERLREAGFEVVDKTAVGLTLASLAGGYLEPFENAPPSDFPNGPQPNYADVPRSTRYVVIEAGVNDLWGLRNEYDFALDLRYTIETVLREGRIPVLTGVVQLGDHPWVTDDVHVMRNAYDAITHELAEQYKIPHANWGSEYPETTDGIHRTQEASDRLVRLLIDAIHGD